MKQLICILALSLPLVTHAYYEEGKRGMAASVGYFNFSSERHLDDDALVGGTFLAVLAPNITGEIFFGGSSPDSTRYDESQKFYSYAADVAYHFTKPDSDAVTYVLGGLGVTDQQDTNDNGNNTLMNVNAGIGAEYFFGPSLSLYTQAVDYYTLSDGKNDWSLQAGIKCMLGPWHHKNQSQPNTRPPVTTGGTTGYYELQERPAAAEDQSVMNFGATS